ncbi:MAG TPA: hypothetical protein VF764_07975, partial [Steroidobacteraceae bacterium]
DSVTIRERLPPGVAAILINRAHSHTDIVLAVIPYVLLRGPVNRLLRRIHDHGKQVQDRKA